MNKKRFSIIAGVILAVGLGVLLFPTARDAYLVHRFVEQNVAARGGEAAWENVEALRFTGTMEIGQGLEVPFVLEQKRPDKMCLEYEFDGATASQCSYGDQGWKLAPFMGRHDPEPMTEAELREAVDGADPRGLLVDYRSRGHRITLMDDQEVGDRLAHVLKVTLPSGAEREVYLDAETGLELKVVSERMLAKRERRVDTVYSDWKATDGLLFARHQETRTEGDDASHALVLKKVQVNPEIEDARFLALATTTGTADY